MVINLFHFNPSIQQFKAFADVYVLFYDKANTKKGLQFLQRGQSSKCLRSQPFNLVVIKEPERDVAVH